MRFHRENTNTTTVGYGRRDRLPLSHGPHSNPTTTAGYADKGTESDVEAQKNGSLKESLLSNEALESTNCVSSVKTKHFQSYSSIQVVPSPAFF